MKCQQMKKQMVKTMENIKNIENSKMSKNMETHEKLFLNIAGGF